MFEEFQASGEIVVRGDGVGLTVLGARHRRHAGSLIGGWLGVVLSPRVALAIAATGLTVGALLLLLSPLGRIRDFEEVDEHASTD